MENQYLEYRKRVIEFLKEYQEAVLRADADCQKNLRIITISTQNCYINEKF